jgi:O-antigen/teichoic acid export membrane protein
MSSSSVTTTPPGKVPESRISGFLRNMTSNWVAILVNVALSFVLAPITVASLGNVYYGIWTLLMQFTGYLWLFDFGVRESVVKYVAQHHASGAPDRVASTVHTAVSIYSLVAAVAMAGSVALAVALPHFFNIPADAVSAARVTTLLAGATVAQSFVFNVYVGVLMGLEKFYLMARLGVIFSIGRAIVVFALLSAGYGIIPLAIVQFLVTLASNLIIYRMCVAQLPYVSLRWVRPAREQAMTLLNYGKYVLVANLGDKIVFATDSIIIGMFLPISAVTYFAIGSSLIDYFRSFIISLGTLLNPLSSSLEARNRNDTIGLVVLSSAKFMVILGLPVCIGFIILGERFIDLWMGAEYGLPAGQILAILAAGHLAGLPYYTISGVLQGLGRHRILAMSRVFEGIANLLLSLFLVRKYGLIGVALGTVIPHVIVVCVILPIFLPRVVSINLRDYYASAYARTFAASVPFWFACWFISTVVQPQNLVTFGAAVSVAMPAYLIPCWFIALTRSERLRARDVLRQRLQPVAA